MPRKFVRKKGPRRGRKRFGRKRRHPKMDKIQSLTVRAPGAIVPDRLKCKLVFQDFVHNLYYAAATNVNGYRYRMNSPYDVDPLMLSTTVVGFAEMATLYQRYRVHGASWRLSVVNREDFPVIVGFTPLNLDPGSAITIATARDLIMNPYTRYKIVGEKGGMDRVFLKGFISTRKIAGTNQANFDDIYAAVVNTIPANPTYISTYCYSLDGTNFVNGVSFLFTMTMYCEFYERNYLTA